MSHIIDQLVAFYREFNTESLSKIRALYDEDARFTDPIHEIQGLEAIERYFSSVMTGVTACRFDFDGVSVMENQAFLQWRMYFKHPRLVKHEICVRGLSVIEFQEKVISHVDYYDMGEMLYEHVPLLGGVIRRLKRRLSE
ncbi:MAG: nuclear transport factor 2 family protein [Agarilytica sp.]